MMWKQQKTCLLNPSLPMVFVRQKRKGIVIFKGIVEFLNHKTLKFPIIKSSNFFQHPQLSKEFPVIPVLQKLILLP